MNNRTLLAAVALSMTSVAPLASAASDAPYLGIQGSYQIPDQDRLTRDGYGGTLLLGAPINDYLAGELNLFGLTADDRTRNGRNEQYGAGLDLAVYPFSRSARVAPFLLAGGGGVYDDRPNNDRGHSFLNAGGGVLVNLTETTALRVDAKRYRVDDDDAAVGNNYLWDTRISAGVQVAFGGGPEPAPVATPPPPAPPADSDGDGVPDRIDQCPGTPAGTTVDARGCPPPPPPAAPKDSDGDGVLDPVDACPGTPLGMKVDERGCAIKTAKIVLRDINFEFDSARLTADSRQSLDKVVEGLRGQSGMELMIEGHTDSVGAEAYNLKLSKQRAEAAREYLISQGIDGGRLTARGLGESQPVTSNQTKDGRAQNRRVEFSVSKQ